MTGMEEASFSSRVAKAFGGLGQWTVSNHGPAAVVASNRRDSDGSDDDDDMFDRVSQVSGQFRERRVPGQGEEFGCNLLDDEEDDETEGFRMRQMVGMDRTLDQEEEEDEHDRVATGMHDDDKLWMGEIAASVRGWQGAGALWDANASRRSLPSSLEELRHQPRDSRADLSAAAARLAQDAAELAEAEARAGGPHPEEPPQQRQDEVQTRLPEAQSIMPSSGMVGIGRIFDRLRGLQEPVEKKAENGGPNSVAEQQGSEPRMQQADVATSIEEKEVPEKVESVLASAAMPSSASSMEESGKEDEGGAALSVSEGAVESLLPLRSEESPEPQEKSPDVEVEDAAASTQVTRGSSLRGGEGGEGEKPKVKKRVRFAPDVKGGEDEDEPRGWSGVQHSEQGEAVGMDWEPQAGWMNPEQGSRGRRKSLARRPPLPRPQRMNTVPDHVKNPQKYTVYALDWSDYGNEQQQHLEALEAAREAVALLRSHDSSGKAEAADGSSVPTSIMFVPKRKARVELEEESEAKKARVSNLQPTSMAAQLEGESAETSSGDEMELPATAGSALLEKDDGGEETKSSFGTPKENGKSFSRRKQKYRASMAGEDDSP